MARSNYEEVRCSFCRKAKDQVRQMFRGEHGANICIECVEFCSDLIEDHEACNEHPADNQEPSPVSDSQESSMDIEFAVQKLRMDGYFILEDLLPQEKIAALRARFLELLDQRIQMDPANRGANRYQMFLPFEPPFSDRELYQNPAVLEILEALMGKDLICTYLASDTPLPGSEYQRVHSDTRLLFPETPLALPSYGVVLNVPLVDFTEENGPLELWPGGTHLMPGPLDIQRLAPEMKSVRLLPRAGSVVLRDLRAWHRGTPNHSNAARPNLALVYTRPWYRFEQKPIEIPSAVYSALPESAQRLLRANAIKD